MNYKKIGNEIKKGRISKDLTQEQLAEQLNISSVHLSNIERGKTKMGLELIVAISKILQISLDELLYSENGLPNQKTVINKKISELLNDCTPCEIMTIYDIIKVTKETLKNNYPQD